MSVYPRRWLVGLTMILSLAASCMPALAVKPDEVLPDKALEARARAISAELRCLVCQNQSIDDSDADLARDLRILVRDRLKLGESDSAIKDYLVARYGEYVLLRPRLSAGTVLLWTAGPIALLAGAAAIYLARRRSPGVAAKDLSAEETARIEALIAASRGEG